MKVKKTVMLIILASVFQSCAPTATRVKVTGISERDQKIFYDGSITSEKKYFVTLSHYTEIELAKGKTIFMIVVENGGEDPISISSDSISVRFEGKGTEWGSKNINIQSPDDFMKDLEEEYYSEEVRIISDIFKRLNMAPSDMFPEKIALFAARFENYFLNNMYKLEETREDFEQLEYTIPEIMLKKRTIVPGDSINAIVVCDTRDMDASITGNFKIIVSIDGEEHRFTFKHSLI